MTKLKLLAAILLSIFLTSCTDSEDKDKWLVATSADNPPYEYMSRGEFAGFDIDMIKAIGKHLDKKIEIKDIEFPGLLAALSSKNVDMVIAAVSITEKRLEKVDFSIPYTDAKIAILYRKDNIVNSIGELKSKIVGAQLGTIWASIAHDMSLEYDFKSKTLSNNLMLVQELQNKRIDAVIMEESQVQKFSEMHSELENFSIDQYSSSFAIALPKDSPLKQDIDKAIIELKNDGTISDLAKKWRITNAQ